MMEDIENEELTQEESDEAMANFFEMEDKMPEEKLKACVEDLRREGYKFSLTKCDWLLRIAQQFRVSLPTALVRVIQVYPKVRKKLAL